MELLANQRIMKMIADAATHVNVQEDTNMHSNTERERELTQTWRLYFTRFIVYVQSKPNN